MLQSLRVSEAGLLAQKNKLEIVANNLANASTPGFKRMLTTFQAVDPQAPGFAGQDPNALPGGTVDVMMPGSMLRMTSVPDLSPGPMQATGNRLDVALASEGLFVFQAAEGERYTRAGNFTISPDDRLVTASGDAVMGEGGPIEIPPASVVEIALDGTVRANGAEVGRLRVVRPESGGNRTERWERIAREAVQQSGAQRPVEVAEPVGLESIASAPRALSLVLHPEPLAQTTLHGYLGSIPDEIELVVGPEGGLCGDEIEELGSRGFQPLWLGPQVLRSESAALFAAAAIRILILERATWQPVET